MKKNVTAFLILLFCNLIGAQKVIENPAFEVTNSGITYISKIELSKTETKIHVHNIFIPKWWVQFKKDIFIKDCASDTKYNILGIEGAEFGEKIRMPKSGEKTIVLIFPPLSEKVKKFDFLGSGYTIFGISLNPKQSNKKKPKSPPREITKWIKDELSKATKTPIKDYNTPAFFNKTPARLIGYIKGYDERLGFSTGIMYMGNDITNEDYPIVIPIEPDGRFEADIPLINPLYTYVNFNKKNINLYLEPEQTLAVVLDWEEFLIADRLRNIRYKFKDINFEGSIAKVNEDLLSYKWKQIDYKSFQNKRKTLSPVAFKKEQLVKQKETSEDLDKYFEANNISAKAKIILQNHNIIESATQLLDFADNRAYYSKKDTLNTILKIPVKDDYYDFLRDIPMNDQSLLILEGFSTFVNRFEFCDPISISPKRNPIKPEKSFEKYLKEANISITENDELLMKDKTPKRFTSLEDYQEYQKKFSEAYRKGLEAYNKKHVIPLVEKRSKDTSLEKWKLRDSVVKNTFKLEKNLVYDMVKIRALDFDIKRSDSESAHKYWNTLKKDIKEPFLKKEGERIVNKRFPIITTEGIDGSIITTANIKVKAMPLPEGRGTDVFKEITDLFKGKILFVDFWATSCAPCVGGIKRMKETRKKHEGNKDFDFIFITDERGSPLKTYDKFVKEQELKNIYRLSTDDYNYLRQLFKFNGIPRYVVIDKNGDVINDDFPMYNFNNLLNGILAQNK